MAFLSSITTLLQTFAAFLIFVVGYLALLFAVFAIFLMGHLLYKGTRFLRSYVHAHATAAGVAPGRLAASRRLAPPDLHLMSRELINSFRRGAAEFAPVRSGAAPKASSHQGF